MEPDPTSESPQPAPPPARGRVYAAWPELAAALLFLGMAGFFIGVVMANEGGRYAYTIDDIYIHMSIAKTLAFQGVWGTSAQAGFSSGASSLVWPALLALCFRLFGVHECWPLVLNLLAAVGLLFYAGRLTRRTTGAGFLSFLVLLGLIGLVPLYPLVSTGMEHCLQALLTLIFVDLSARLLTRDAQRLTSWGAEATLCAVAGLMVATRYEGLFVAAPVGLLLLCQRRWRLAILRGVAAAAPVTLFGFYAVSKGWYFLPNTLLLKTNAPPVRTWAEFVLYISRWYTVLSALPYVSSLVTVLTVALVASLQRQWSLWSYPALFLFIALLTTVEHLQFAALGWFYRYEAYLIVLAVVGVGVAMGYDSPRLGRDYWWSARPLPYYAGLALAAVIFGEPFRERSVEVFGRTAQASYNIYEQQYQVGRFVQRFYRGKGVAANDIGTVNFLGEINLLDLYGLTNLDVFRARRAHTINNETIRELCKKHGVELVVGYPEWGPMYGGLLPEWVPVGRWIITKNVIAAYAGVTFFAPNLASAPRLMQELQEFSVDLPKDVIQTGLYRGSRLPQVSGIYGVVADDSLTSYTTPNWLQVAMLPPENAPLGSPDTLLQLTVLPVAKGVSVEVFVNDQLVGTRTFPPDNPPNNWIPLRVKARWQAGVNTVRVAGRGAPVPLTNGPRPPLFQLLDPRKIMVDGAVLTQGVITTADP